MWLLHIYNANFEFGRRVVQEWLEHEDRDRDTRVKPHKKAEYGMTTICCNCDVGTSPYLAQKHTT